MTTITCPHCSETISIDIGDSGQIEVVGSMDPKVLSNSPILKNMKVSIEAPSETDIAKARFEHAAKVGKPIVEMPEDGQMYYPSPPPKTDPILAFSFGIFVSIVLFCLYVTIRNMFKE